MNDQKKIKSLILLSPAQTFTWIKPSTDLLKNIVRIFSSKEKQMELWEGFETIETQKIGPGKHEAFHQMIESLEKIYLT